MNCARITVESVTAKRKNGEEEKRGRLFVVALASAFGLLVVLLTWLPFGGGFLQTFLLFPQEPSLFESLCLSALAICQPLGKLRHGKPPTVGGDSRQDVPKPGVVRMTPVSLCVASCGLTSAGENR